MRYLDRRNRACSEAEKGRDLLGRDYVKALRGRTTSARVHTLREETLGKREHTKRARGNRDGGAGRVRRRMKRKKRVKNFSRVN